MKYKSKRLRDSVSKIDLMRKYSAREAIEVLKQVPVTKFDQTMELSLSLNVDPKKADQQVRGTVSLPHGTGKKSVILVFAKGDKEKEAREAGAEYVGSEDLADKIAAGWVDFTEVVATPDMMRLVGKLGKVLGPRGLMPTPKAGTVTNDVAGAIRDIKAGKIEFKVDKNGNLNTFFGKMSFPLDHLAENFRSLLEAISKSRPVSVKGSFIKSVAMSSTMGPGLEIEHHVVQTG
ncbi:MAG: 50S ribosomal protein L1 [Chlamydiae bacterium]|jgi:large subunit ribosomal protein L1|nr:50S ribosomal protein L1 [Chlamydiota bacterium]